MLAIRRYRCCALTLVLAVGFAAAATDSAAQSLFLLQLPSTDGKDVPVAAETLADLRLREAPTEMPVREPLMMLGRFSEVLQELLPGDLADFVVSVQLQGMERELQDPVPECGRPVGFVGPNLWVSDFYADQQSEDGKHARLNLRFSHYEERCGAIRLMAHWVQYNTRGPYGMEGHHMDRSLVRLDRWQEVKAEGDAAAGQALSCVAPQALARRPVSYRKDEGKGAASWTEAWQYAGCGRTAVLELRFDYAAQSGLAWRIVSTGIE